MKKTKKNRAVENILGMLAALGLCLISVAAVENSTEPALTRRERPSVLPGYNLVLIGDYTVPARFVGEPFVLVSDTGDTLCMQPGDIPQFKDIKGGVLPGMAHFCEVSHARAYPELFPNGIRYTPTTTWSKPHPVAWKGKEITLETAPTVANPVFMPRSMGPEMPWYVPFAKWAFPDLNQPYGMLFASVKSGPLWARTGIPLTGGEVWAEVQKSGPLVLYLNYNDMGLPRPLRPANASVEWQGIDPPWGLTYWNEGGFTVRVCVWRPQTPPEST